MSSLSEFHDKPPSAVGQYRRLQEQELQAAMAPVVHAASLAVEAFGEDALELHAEINAAYAHAENRRQALQKSEEGLMPLHTVRRTGEVPCAGWNNPFRDVQKPIKGYRDPESDKRQIIEVEVDCSCCSGTGYYRSRNSYCGPCRLCNGSGLIVVRAYPIVQSERFSHGRCCG